MTDRNTSIRRSQLKPIQYDDLDSTNVPNDNDVPSYDLATGKFTWIAAGGAGATDKIEEGNTSVEVIDAGDGYIVFTEDGSEIARFTAGNFGIGIDSPSSKLTIKQSSNENCLEIDNDGTKHALYIHQDEVWDTNQYGIYLYSNSAHTNLCTFLKIHNDNASASQAWLLYLINDAAPSGLYTFDMETYGLGQRIISYGTIHTLVRLVGNNITTAQLIYASSNSSDNSSRNLVEIKNDNASADNTVCISIQQDGADYCLYANGYHIDADGTGHDASSKSLKSEFEDMTVLDKINNVLTQKYRYNIWKEKGIERRSFSPCSENFYEVFGLGDETSISSKDLAGVAFKGVQELLNEIELLKNEIKILRERK